MELAPKARGTDMRLLSIDPGTRDSAYCIIDQDYRLCQFGKVANEDLLASLRTSAADRAVIEMVASYGMAVGAEVFETCVWIGRFAQVLTDVGIDVEYVKRNPVKLHHCGSSLAKDSNIIQALADRFAPGEPNRGKGTQKAPGYFYGFKADVWQAYALAVYAMDTATDTAA